MGKLRKAEIYWHYPRTVDNIYNSQVCVGSWGIYSISRVLGGKETLLYIGLTFDQCFVHRIQRHQVRWFNKYRGSYVIRFGEFQKPNYITKDIIEDIESALIYELKPKHNTSKVSSYRYTYEYLLLNKGFRGTLPKEISMRMH